MIESAQNGTHNISDFEIKEEVDTIMFEVYLYITIIFIFWTDKKCYDHYRCSLRFYIETTIQ